MVERVLAKDEVAGSSPVSRSILPRLAFGGLRGINNVAIINWSLPCGALAK